MSVSSKLNTFLESESENDEEDEEQVYDDKKVNFIRIPWEGCPPKIITKKSEKHVLSSPFDNDDINIRSIWFCRDINDKRRRTLKVWDLPLTWNNDNIHDAFKIFGDIKSITIRNHNNIIDRHCLIRFKESSKVDFAMNYDSNLIIQPLLKGSIKWGINKYLINYIKSRPLNINQLQFDVDRFMSEFDKLQKQKKEKQRAKPRRHRGWIQKRDKDGFTKIHYVNKWERKKNKAFRINIDNESNDNNIDSPYNAPPEPKVYDLKRKEAYYQMNQIKDIYKKREKKLFIKQNKAKQKIKKQISGQYIEQSKQRMSIARSRLKQSMERKQKWQKDMTQTTTLRKNRKFKP